jgi:hypothetical protein
LFIIELFYFVNRKSRLQFTESFRQDDTKLVGSHMFLSQARIQGPLAISQRNAALLTLLNFLYEVIFFQKSFIDIFCHIAIIESLLTQFQFNNITFVLAVGSFKFIAI